MNDKNLLKKMNPALLITSRRIQKHQFFRYHKECHEAAGNDCCRNYGDSSHRYDLDLGF